jgi:uncharacterized repeat protein (TIGR03803 family)
MTLRSSPLVRSALVATIAATLCFSATFATGSNEFIVHRFGPPPNVQGCLPQGNLVADSAGNLYGTADCGASNRGVVFKMTRPVPPSTAWTESVLYSFTGNQDGLMPVEGVIFDAAGNLYGTTVDGGVFGLGMVFELSPPPAGQNSWTETVLHSFQGGASDGAMPTSGLIWDHSGNLYGVSWVGGHAARGNCPQGCGAVYELSPPAASASPWTVTVLHSFNVVNGANPFGNLVFDAKGYLYGTTLHGGESNFGVAYKLAPSTRTFIVLHVFSGADGAQPNGGMTFHGRGVLYGTTGAGGGSSGVGCGNVGCGTVFQLVPPTITGGAWTENVLYAFTGLDDGAGPNPGVIFDAAGNLYDAASGGGGAECTPEATGCGVVFKLSPPAAGGSTWTETVMHAFPSSASDAAFPSSGLILGEHGILFGIAESNGINATDGGAVYGIIK